NVPRFESNGIEKFFLSRDNFAEVVVRLKVEGRLNPRMTQDALHGLRILLRLVHQPIREAVSEVV
ncbi:MAG TPA: hypothetical protein VFV92_12455, partial [Candidatus Bathyarchaeia archaeon]|nr:hypothetical protein [Candidatus Bathyarchaeia archaeon]